MRRLPFVFLLTVVAVLALAGTASAHTELLRTAPVDGSTVQPDVGGVTLTFTKAVDPRLATVAVRSQDGELKSEGPPRRERLALVQSLAPLTAGRYEVQWRAAAADGHILTGDFRFRAGNPSTPSSAAAGDAGGLSPAELLRQHAKGNADHDALPSYAVGSGASQRDDRADRVATASPPVEVGPPAAPVDPATAPSPPETDNAAATIVALLAAALAVTSVTAVVELRRP